MQNTISVLKRTAVFIRSVVEPRGQEFGDQISAYGMYGDGIEASTFCVEAAPSHAVDHRVYLVNSHRPDRGADESGLERSGGYSCNAVNALAALIIGEPKGLRTAARADVYGALRAVAVYRLGKIREHGDIHIVIHTD